MYFFKTLLIGATTLATLAAAQTKLAFTVVPTSIQGGRTYTVKYEGGNGGPVTILLRKGDAEALKTIDTLTTTATGGTFQWTVDNGLVSGNDYALEIKQGDANNYQGPLAIAAAGTPTSSRSTVSSTTRTTSTSSATRTVTTSSSSRSITSTKTVSRTKTTTESTSTPANTSTGSAPQDTDGAAANLKGNSALLLGAIAAVAYLA